MAKYEIQKLKKLRPGLAVFRSNRSEVWYLRVFDKRRKEEGKSPYLVRSTKERTQVEAISVAEEFYTDYFSSVNYIDIAKEFSFGYFAELLSAYQRDIAGNTRSARLAKDDNQILYRKDDGLVAHFGKKDVREIKTVDLKSYFLTLDRNRKKPLAVSTKNKHGILLRKVFIQAQENGALNTIPVIPKFGTKDNPRVSFTESEYKHLLETIRASNSAGDKVNGNPIDSEFNLTVVFIVNSFLRPTISELMGLRHRDVVELEEPKTLQLQVAGKTGHRVSNTMEFAVRMYQQLTNLRDKISPNDYVFLPHLKNREYALRTLRERFNFVLDKADLKIDANDKRRSLYSLRHYAFQTRLTKSKGRVNIYNLAKNGGTSVSQLERFYLKHAGLSAAEIANLQSFGD